MPKTCGLERESRQNKEKSFNNCVYWGKPVPGFGDINGKVLVLGLAPGAHGSNRTGRMFTGDASGNFLYPALFSAGFANQAESQFVNDGLNLINLYISAVCRCAPPDNKPTSEEITNCSQYLEREIELMKNLTGIVALGKIAFESSLKLKKMQIDLKTSNQPVFGHGRLYFAASNSLSTPWLLASYHPSRQNTQTGRLTKVMFCEIWVTTNRLIQN